jgi:hypothetical protein
VTFGGRARVRSEDGTALILAMLFLTVSAVILGGLLTYANTSARTTNVLRSARSNDYDAQQTMDAAIATVRTGTTCSASGTTVYTPPTSQLNTPGRPLRVDCFAPASFPVIAQRRNYVFLVCPTSAAAPCTDSQALLSANVTFYDKVSPANISIQTWSNQ